MLADITFGAQELVETSEWKLLNGSVLQTPLQNGVPGTAPPLSREKARSILGVALRVLKLTIGILYFLHLPLMT